MLKRPCDYVESLAVAAEFGVDQGEIGADTDAVRFRFERSLKPLDGDVQLSTVIRRSSRES